MSGITIWTLESDYDRDAVKYLAEKLIHYRSLPNISIRSLGKSQIPKKIKGENDPAKALSRAVELYLKEDKCVIFVIDKDGVMSSHQRLKEPNSLINQIQKIVNDETFSGRVHLAWAVCELEAWLLVDCAGIFCYFAHTKNKYKQDCRNAISDKKNIMKLIGKYQKGNTELITEAVSGGKGVKEYLTEFSKDILKTLNPKMKDKDIADEKYRERLSPEIAKFIEINADTVKRNNSLQYLGKLISQCQNV